MDVRKKMVLIVTSSILLTALPGAALIYGYTKSNILEHEGKELEKFTAISSASAMQRFTQGEPKLKALAELLEKELARPASPEEIKQFHSLMEKNPDGVWRNRRQNYDGKRESGVFLPPNPQESDAQKIRHLRIKRVMDTFGAAANKPFENVWYLSPHRSEIIFDRALPEFAFEQKADNDYTNTPWVTYTKPESNPRREFRFTPPLFDPVPKIWMVSALYPLYVNGEWVGSLGEDMPLSGVLESMFTSSQIFSGVQHFLIDTQGNFVLAGLWQKQLESTPETFRPDFRKEPELAALLKLPVSDKSQILSQNVNVDGTQYLAIGIRLEPLGWKYFRLTPIDEIMGYTKSLFLALVLMIIAVTTLAGAIIGTAAGASITRRIRMLSALMKTYSQDRQHHIEKPLEGNDEIAEAAHVFESMATDIERTNAKQHETEESLRQSEEMWRFALEGAGDGVWDVNMATGQATYSRRYEEMLGYTEGELQGNVDTWLSLIHPDDQPVVDKEVQAYVEGQSPIYRCEYRLRSKTGEYRWILARGMAASRDAQGKPLRMIGTHTDMTERKENEERLRTLSVAIEQSPTSIVITDLDARLQYVNPQFCRATGYSPEEVLGSNPRVLQSGLTSKETYQAMWETLTAGKVWQGELINRRKNGDIYWEEAYIAPVTDKAGHTTHYVGVKFDISSRKRSDDAIRLLNERMQNLLDAASEVSIIATDEFGVITVFNRGAEHMLGYTSQEIVDKETPALFHLNEEVEARCKELGREQGIEVEGFGAFVAMARAEGQEQREWTYIRKDKSQLTVSLVVTRVHGPDGSITGYLGIAQDITQRKLTEQELIAAKEAAEAAAQIKSVFLANMSHEIRTPMNGIIGLSQLALEKPVSPEVHDYLEKIRTSSLSLLGILNDILDYSKMEAGHMHIEQDIFNLDRVLGNLLNLFSVRAEEKKIKLSIDAAADVPKHLIGDSLRIQQVLTNLIGNAIKFTDSGKVTLKVQLKDIAESGARVEFSVEDTGIGMTEENLSRLFMPFSQLDTSITRRFGGTGLGLTISQNLLKLMDSAFLVTSRPGEGSRFSFELILGISDISENPHQSLDAPKKRESLTSDLKQLGTPMAGSKILVAEDNLINQQVVKEFLQLSGMEVMLAGNGQIAIELLQKEKFDAILMDAHMPVMGGIEATRLIRQQPEFDLLPIIALSAGVTTEERDNCLAAGMNDFVAKPVNPTELLESLQRWLQPQTSTAPTANPVEASSSDSQLELPGFDLGNLLKMLGGNQDLARELLRNFASDMAEVPAQIRAEATSGDLGKARETAHKLKGAAGNLGAQALHAAAQTLEATLKTGRFEMQELETLEQAFDAAILTIATLRSPPDAQQRKTDSRAFEEGMKQLIGLVDQNDFVPQELLSGLRENCPFSMQAQFDMLCRLIAKFEYAKAREIIKTFITT